MGVGAGLYMCDVVKKFTFAISSPDEFFVIVAKRLDAIKMPLGMEAGLSPGDFVLDVGTQRSPPLKGYSPPQFSANVRCGQTAGWAKMPLGTEVNLGPGDVVLGGVAASP